jgi:hypothetical protein
VGKWIRQLYDVILRGIAEGRWSYDEKLAQNAIRFIERFCQIEQMDREEQKSLLRKTVDQIAVTPEDIGLFMTVKRGVVIAINKL